MHELGLEIFKIESLVEMRHIVEKLLVLSNKTKQLQLEAVSSKTIK